MTESKQHQPRIEERTEQPCIVIPIKVTLQEWGKANALVPQLFGWLAQHNTEPAGALFFRYYTIGDMDKAFSLEVGVPVKSAIPCNNPIHPSTIAGGSYATLIHAGHPDRLTQSFDKLQAWAEKQGIEWAIRHEDGEDVWGGRFEFYLTNPAEQPDPEQWSTEIAWLLQD
ncbi:MAG: AraC family transcriptional regulator [Chloroflexi bacterium AL-W]|nr:AraC family transcriptional regulator [Chloroflexi bacterium AL-N1]NOK70292.1 AraC family transcriptional regulator [Chloroflexi bacterium AL-N10]NOK77829.1 AraC family transcriptional regulator [Chloroflexi bacterium AL-N5]NOK84838.1 AraC family transcriptional regulator [Chloroflexi bacterium AL-W]NOK92445.1 AraC family transcriptional regulator [Chloroflexi bacterium AL-N15]